MNKFLTKIIFLTIFASSVPAFAAQNVSVRNSVDSTVMLIGNQTRLNFTVLQPREAKVAFPALRDTVSAGVEIVSERKPDTTVVSADRIEISKDYVVAVYDSGAYFIPEMPFVEIAGRDTAWSRPLALKIYTYEIDTLALDSAQNMIFDIKPIQKPPFSWRIFFVTLGWILLALALLAAVVYVVWRLKNRKSILPKKTLPERDPYDVAVDGLTKIRSEKLWQKDREKEYQTQLTDVLRKYLNKRFGIDAFEKTSDEILDEVAKVKDCDGVRDDLRQILKTADMVKFAKVRLAPEENERSISQAFDFVEKTKKQADAAEKEEGRP